MLKVTQKHFRQPYRPSKVPLRPAGGKTSEGRLFCTDRSGAKTFSSLRSVWLCPVISLPGYIPDHHGKVSPPDTSSGQHPFPSGSIPICHPLKSAGIPHSAIRYQSISPMTRYRIFRCYCCNQAFLLSFSSPLSNRIKLKITREGCPETGLPFRNAKNFRPHICCFSLSANDTGACHAPVLS